MEPPEHQIEVMVADRLPYLAGRLNQYTIHFIGLPKLIRHQHRVLLVSFNVEDPELLPGHRVPSLERGALRTEWDSSGSERDSRVMHGRRNETDGFENQGTWNEATECCTGVPSS